MPNLLFVCSRNRLRSPTAEAIFAHQPGISTASAGLAPDADTPLSADLIDWADTIFIMENRHRSQLNSRFGKQLKDKKLVCLNIPDNYEFMDPALIDLLWERVPRSCPTLGRSDQK